MAGTGTTTRAVPAAPGPADERPAGEGLVAVVSTVKATVAATVSHVERNLRAGADHVFLFVDDADPAVCAAWADHPHATAVPTDAAYWGGRRPDHLAPRQGVNANLVNLALTMVPEVEWLFSLDADECLHIDRDRLLTLDASVRVVRLTTWEAASVTGGEGQPPRWYKRPLDADELDLLVERGVLGEPRMTRYFRGHRRKIGVRPHRRLRMYLHDVETVRGRTVPKHRDPEALRVLHDESPTLEDFVDKWSAHVQGGGHHAIARRKAIRRAFLALDDPGVSPEERRAVLARLYERVALDDVASLRSLGLLEVPDPSLHRHTPVSLDPGRHRRMVAMLEALCEIDKSLLAHRPRPRPKRALRHARRRLPAGSELAAELGASLPAPGARVPRQQVRATRPLPARSQGERVAGPHQGGPDEEPTAIRARPASEPHRSVTLHGSG